MTTEEFFNAVRTGKISDLDIYNYIQKITDDFDETKLNLLCNDFDFYLFMEQENWLASVSDQVDQKIQEYNDQDKKIPMLSDREIKPAYVSDHFKTPEHKKIKKKEDWTEEELKNLEKMGREWQEAKKRIIDTEKLIDPHGVEFFSIYRLRSLLVELKRKHTSAVYKFDDKPQEKPFKKKDFDIKSVDDFFNLVKNGQLGGLNIHNKIQELTDDYDAEKLNLLCNDFDDYLGILYEQWLGTFTEDDIQKKIEAVKEADKKLPLKTDKAYDPVFVDDHFKQSASAQTSYVKSPPIVELIKKEIKAAKDNPIDVDRLFGGFFNSNYTNHSILILRNSLVNLKRKHTSSVYRFNDKPEDLQANNNHINWLKKNDDSLEQFIRALIEQNLIEQREPKAIIKDHFEPVREQNSEPEPIRWQESIALLAYMIEQLDRRSNKYIDPDDIWKDTVLHFTKNGQPPENMKQTANRYKRYNKSSKPKNYQIIDNIIQSLSD